MAIQSNTRELSVVLTHQTRGFTPEKALRSLTHQTLAPEKFEVFIPMSARLDSDEEWPFAIHRYTHLSQTVEQCAGRWVLFLHSSATLSDTLLDTHLAVHRQRPEDRLTVMGTTRAHDDYAHNPLARYLEEDSVLNPYRGLLSMGPVPAKDIQLHNFSAPVEAIITHGNFDPSFVNQHISAIDLCFRLHDAGFKTLYCTEAKTTRPVLTDLAQIAREQTALAQHWVTLLVKHPQRVREWGALRHATRMQFETQADELSEEATERRNIIEQLAGFHFDTDPLNPVGSPDTQRRILRTIDEQFTPLHKGWWSAGFAEGLHSHRLDSFETLLIQTECTDDLFAQHHLMIVGDTLHPLQQKALFDWSATVDEHSLGGLVVATTTTNEDHLDRLATHIASTVLRACPDTAPAAVHLVHTDASKEDLRPLFLATDRWIAQPGVHARSLVTTAHQEGCDVHWLPDTGVMHTPNLPGNLRIGLWPDWEGYTDLLTLIDKWWPALSARQDCSIVLFHEKNKASRAKRSAQTLQELLDQSAQGDHTAHVVTARAPQTDREQAYWRTHLDGVIQLPSGYGPERMRWLTQLNARPFFSPIELERHLVDLHLLTDQLLGHAPEATAPLDYQEVHEQLS